MVLPESAMCQEPAGISVCAHQAVASPRLLMAGGRFPGHRTAMQANEHAGCESLWCHGATAWCAANTPKDKLPRLLRRPPSSTSGTDSLTHGLRGGIPCGRARPTVCPSQILQDWFWKTKQAQELTSLPAHHGFCCTQALSLERAGASEMPEPVQHRARGGLGSAEQQQQQHLTRVEDHGAQGMRRKVPPCCMHVSCNSQVPQGLWGG